MTKNLINLEKDLKIKFKNKSLLKAALTHKSASQEINNEKLEFLGDRVLGLVLSKELYDLYPNVNEGELDKRFSILVNRKTCLKISKTFNFEKFLILGKTYKNKKFVEDKILSDTVEALVGAIFLDLGFTVVEKFILHKWKEELNKSSVTVVDSKTKLQEYSLKIYKKLPLYKVLKLQGPKHNPSYKVGVKIMNTKQYIGNGKSIKLAQQSAAKSLLADIK